MPEFYNDKYHENEFYRGKQPSSPARNSYRVTAFGDFRKHDIDSIPPVEAGKPGTFVQLAYENEDATEVSIFRLFANADAMQAHLQGSGERSPITYEFVMPISIEVFGGSIRYSQATDHPSLTPNSRKEQIMPVKARASGVIEHPVSKVFQFHAIEHVQNHPRWDPDIHLEQVTEGPMGVGTMIKRLNTRSGQPVEGTMEVVEFEPDRAVTMIIHDGPVKMVARATYEAESEGHTRLTMNIEFPDMEEMDTDMLVTAMQRSIRNINQLLHSEDHG